MRPADLVAMMNKKLELDRRRIAFVGDVFRCAARWKRQVISIHLQCFHVVQIVIWATPHSTALIRGDAHLPFHSPN